MPIEKKIRVGMYEIPKHGPVARRSLERYWKKQKRYDEPSMPFEDIVEGTAKNQRAELIRNALDHDSPGTRRNAAETIWAVPKNQRAELIHKALNNPDLEVQKNASWQIILVPENQRAELILEAIANSNPEIQLNAGEMIRGVPENQRAELEQAIYKLASNFLNRLSLKVKLRGARLAKYVSENRTDFSKKLSDCLNRALSSSDQSTQEEAVQIMYTLEKTNEDFLQILTEFIDRNIDNSDPQIQIKAARILKYIEARRITDFIYRALKSPSSEVQREAAAVIHLAPKNQMAGLVCQALDSTDLKTVQKAAETLPTVPEEERSELEKILAKIISKYLVDPDPKVRRSAAWMLPYLPQKEAHGLFELAIENGTNVWESRLYHDQIGLDGKFVRRRFIKTGSKTILLGGSLKDKIIIRQINEKSFLAWRKLYENEELWEKNGFDYVPIEPIFSFQRTGQNLVNVASGVLDMSLGDWTAMTDRFAEDLRRQKDKINEVVRKAGVEHGHNHHEYNFCLSFHRDNRGKPDINVIPRLYLIDFDEAHDQAN